MLNLVLSTFYERDLRKLIEELRSFNDERNIWRTAGTVKNSCGNLVLHIVGGSSFLIGRQLGGISYVRNREQEFTMKDIPRNELIVRLEQLIILITSTLATTNMEAEFPIPFDDAKRTNTYVVTQLALHLNYHLGQVNYLRRILE
jgi:hypothetical protein